MFETYHKVSSLTDYFKTFVELMHQKDLLSTEPERMCLLEEIPEIVPDREQTSKLQQATLLMRTEVQILEILCLANT